MDSVYQETICIQPIIIATHHQPRLIEIEKVETDEDGNAMDFGGDGEGAQ